jgi:hypothetical protein
MTASRRVIESSQGSYRGATLDAAAERTAYQAGRAPADREAHLIDVNRTSRAGGGCGCDDCNDCSSSRETSGSRSRSATTALLQILSRDENAARAILKSPHARISQLGGLSGAHRSELLNLDQGSLRALVTDLHDYAWNVAASRGVPTRMVSQGPGAPGQDPYTPPKGPDPGPGGPGPGGPGPGGPGPGGPNPGGPNPGGPNPGGPGPGGPGPSGPGPGTGGPDVPGFGDSSAPGDGWLGMGGGDSRGGGGGGERGSGAPKGDGKQREAHLISGSQSGPTGMRGIFSQARADRLAAGSTGQLSAGKGLGEEREGELKGGLESTGDFRLPPPPRPKKPCLHGLAYCKNTCYSIYFIRRQACDKKRNPFERIRCRQQTDDFVDGCEKNCNYNCKAGT